MESFAGAKEEAADQARAIEEEIKGLELTLTELKAEVEATKVENARKGRIVMRRTSSEGAS